MLMFSFRPVDNLSEIMRCRRSMSVGASCSCSSCSCPPCCSSSFHDLIVPSFACPYSLLSAEGAPTCIGLIASGDTQNYDNNEALASLVLGDAGAVTFTVQAPNDAYISFFSSSSTDTEMYEIVLGGWSNTRSAIRRCRSAACPNQVDVFGSDLSGSEPRPFWADVVGGLVRLGSGSTVGTAVLMEWQDPEPHQNATHVGVMTGWGANGTWTDVCDTGGSSSSGAHPFLTLPSRLHPGLAWPGLPACLPVSLPRSWPHDDLRPAQPHDALLQPQALSNGSSCSRSGRLGRSMSGRCSTSPCPRTGNLLCIPPHVDRRFHSDRGRESVGPQIELCRRRRPG